MGFSAIIDVFISLSFMFLVLSLLCTTLSELVASGWKLRAHDLSNAVTQLIDNETLRDAFYNHGLIAGSKIASRAGKMPGVESQDTPVDPAKGAETKEKGRPSDPDHPSYIDGRTFAMALLASLDPKNPDPPFGVSELQNLINALPDSNIRDVLQTNIATAGSDLIRLRDNVATWFDSSMERLSGSFKRTMKRITLVAGFVIAGLFNADSIRVADAVWKDPVLRAQIAADAAKTSNQLFSGAQCPGDAGAANPGGAAQAGPNAGSAPPAPPAPGGAAPPAPAVPEGAPPAGQNGAKAVSGLDCHIQALQNQNQALRALPLGWGNEAFPTWDWRTFTPYIYIFLKLIGILATTLALSLGAPFWFDLLQKVANIRGTGPKPDAVKSGPVKKEA